MSTTMSFTDDLLGFMPGEILNEEQLTKHQEDLWKNLSKSKKKKNNMPRMPVKPSRLSKCSQ
jgi:hypothetical protein